MSNQQREPESNAEQVRLAAFRERTTHDERDRLALHEFELAIHHAAGCAAMMNPLDKSPEAAREHAALNLALGGMLFRVLPRVDLGVLVAHAEGIGYAVRFGVIEARVDALDRVENTEGYRAIAQRGFDAQQADTDLRVAKSPREGINT